MLNVPRLKGKILTALTNQSNDPNKDPIQARQDTANEIAQAVVDEIKELKITYVAGLVAPPTGGPVTGVLNVTLS